MNQEKSSDSISFSSGYATVNGLKMYYEIYGSGKPLVLLHGGGSTIQTSFGRIIPLLAASRQIIAIELQAHGRTGDRDTGISFEQDADDASALLRHLKISKADFLGFSNGATTVVQIAIRFPDLADHIIVASGMTKRSGAPPQFWEFMKKGTIEEMPAALVSAYREVAPDAAHLPFMFRKCADRMIYFKDISDDKIRAIRSPALIVCGDHDVNTAEHALELHRLISGSRLCILPGDHGTYLGEITTLASDSTQYQAFARIVGQFLENEKL
jgi:pimeloyl-ACP methyl ester carboxylesterase